MIVFFLTQVLPGERGRSAAARVLLSAAEIAGEQEPAEASGPFRYQKTRVAQVRIFEGHAGPWTVLIRSTRELWIAPDGSGRELVSSVGLSFPSDRDRERWKLAGSPQIGEETDREYPSGGLPYVDPARFPTDPETMESVLRASSVDAGRPVQVEIFVQIVDLLRLPDASPELRATLFEVAAGLPRIELLGETWDEVGREGTGVSIAFADRGAPARMELVFDPSTSRVLETRTEVLGPVPWTAAEPPILNSYTLFLEGGFTDTTSELP